MKPMNMKPKYPGMCIMCEGDLPEGLKGHVCSPECFREMLMLSAADLARVIQAKFEIDTDTAAACDWATEHEDEAKAVIEETYGPREERVQHTEEFARPMGVTPPREPKIVTYKRDTSPFTWFKGETPEAVVEDLLATL